MTRHCNHIIHGRGKARGIHTPQWAALGMWLRYMIAGAMVAAVAGCGTGGDDKRKRDEFFTSGSREADQRAAQRMAKEEQLGDTGEDSDKKGTEKPKDDDAKRTLYERLGGEKGLTAIVEDFTDRVMHDPRVNWARTGVKRSGFPLRWGREEVITWSATADNVARLKKHLVQFLALATGGPPTYEGKDMKAVHAPMQIDNSQFDAVIGDMKASLDRLGISTQEQKELLAIIESTRPQVVTVR